MEYVKAMGVIMLQKSRIGTFQHYVQGVYRQDLVNIEKSLASYGCVTSVSRPSGYLGYEQFHDV